MESANGQTSIWIGGFRFVILPHLSQEYQVRVTTAKGETFGLEHPTPEFETEIECMRAILSFLETKKGTLK